MRVTKGGAGEAQDEDLIGFQLADAEDLHAPIRAGVPRKRRKDADAVLGDIVGGCGHSVRDGQIMPVGGGIAGRLLA